MRIDWVIPAEAFVADSRGATTVVGFNQNTLVVDRPQVHVRGAFLAQLSEDSGRPWEPGEAISFKATVEDAEGAVLFVQDGSGNIGPRPGDERPMLVNFSVEYQLVTTGYGRYGLSIEARIGDREPVRGLGTVWVQPSPAA